MPAELAARLADGDRDAVPLALNLVDDGRPEQRDRARKLLDLLRSAQQPPGATRVGITGAPGAGKSTLLDALVRTLRARERSVGILAIDPSSQRTGGALLGDRFRVRSGASDDGVYMRSMAARERLGGLADATGGSIEILAAVFDTVFVETVGVGQSEGEIAWMVDSLVFVAQPGAGDTLQFMKAGILELPDIFFVNKSDLGAVASRTAHELAAGLSLGSRDDARWQTPVLEGSARDGTGIEELVEAIDSHQRHLLETGELETRRQRGRIRAVIESLASRYGSHGLAQIGGAAAIEARVCEADGDGVPSIVARLAEEILEAMRAGG